MFGLFGKTKKNKIQELIEKDGLEHADLNGHPL